MMKLLTNGISSNSPLSCRNGGDDCSLESTIFDFLTLHEVSTEESIQQSTIGAASSPPGDELAIYRLLEEYLELPSERTVRW